VTIETEVTEENSEDRRCRQRYGARVSERDEYARRWPQFGLRIDIDGAHLEPPTDPQVEILALRAAQPGAVLPLADSHFVKWLHGRTPEDIEQQRAERIRSNRDLTDRPGWTLDLAVIVDDEPVGLQSVSGFDQWPHRRIIGTTSWLFAPYQRGGLGTRCRAAILELAFAHLGAEAAKSWALEENRGSIAVSTNLGYQQIDRHVIVENGRELTELVYEITSERWLTSPPRHRYTPVIIGAQPVVTLLAAP